jgi:SapC
MAETAPRYIAITRDGFSGKKWQRSTGYRFAAENSLAPIVTAELSRAALALPLAFLQKAGSFVLVAVLSLTPGRNTLVGPDGRWLGNYIPACFRSYPFRLIPMGETGQLGLCIEADGGSVQGGPAGEDFFDQDGNLSPALKKVFDFLSQFERSRQATDVAVSVLAEAGIIKPWPIRIAAQENRQEVAGLHGVDEAALNALSDEAFLKLRKSVALPIAYAQLLSASLIVAFERLALNELKPKPAARLPESLDGVFGISNDDLIKFD